MQVQLTQEIEGLIQARVASGLYSSPAEVIREALLLIAYRDGALEAQRERLQHDVNAGLDELDRGEFVTPTAKGIMDKIDDRLRGEQ